MRASSKAAKPHSYGDSFSALGRLGPSTLPTTISAMPIPVATIRNSRVGRYSASTLGPLVPVRRPVSPAGLDRRRLSCCVWCPRGDSNPHDLRRYHLKVVRLPIPPPGQSGFPHRIALRSETL